MFTVLTGCFIILMSEINDARGVLHPGTSASKNTNMDIGYCIISRAHQGLMTKGHYFRGSRELQLLIDHLRPFILNLTHPKQISMV